MFILFEKQNLQHFVILVIYFTYWVNLRSSSILLLKPIYIQTHPFRGVLGKRCTENIQQIYRRTPMTKCDFSTLGMDVLLYICCIFSENLLLRTPLDGFCVYPIRTRGVSRTTTNIYHRNSYNN